MFKGISEAVGESSFLGLVLAGTAVVVLAPAMKSVLRGVALATAKGVVSITEGTAALASNAKEGWEDVVAQAKAQKGNLNSSTIVGAGAGGAIGASIGGMAGPAGAAIGGGLGSVTGASVGSEMNNDTQKNQPKD
ncbi:glycine zipper domain-containing protein [Desulfosporosinus sp. SB140]|uniref:glycine zipper domain-containing protein n=1 Tax=Desulfosporosinus paludis TaxID=3115649 RepID=UPI00388F99D4